METKICKQCKQELPLNNFTKSKIIKDGYENKCKKCHKEFHDKYGYRNNNEEQLNEFINEHGNQLPTKQRNHLEV